MITILKKLLLRPRKAVDFSCVLVTYKSKNGTWRGFVHPYNITTEAESKNQALTALREMADIYEEGLKKHDYPSHLANKHLADEEDSQMFDRLAINSIINQGAVKGKDYYAETKTVPA
ncbi:MAG: hypothetical protein AAB690_02470 [Patescibacteria group bacterium]